MFATAQHHLQGSQTVGMATHGDDSSLYVEFETIAVHQPFASEEAGRPIFKDTPQITIHFAGDKTKKVVRPATQEDQHRFPRQWAAFQSQQEQVGDGLPITEWAPLTKSQAAELKAMNIHTVEALAAMPDSACSWLGSRELRAQAASWLQSAAGNAQEASLRAENNRLQAQIDALQQQVKDIAAAQSASPPTAPRKASTKE